MKRFLFLCLLILASCSEDPNPIPAEMSIYVQEFKTQAEMRGIKVNLGRLSIVYGDERAEGRLGKCKRNTHRKYEHLLVTLDREYVEYNLKWHPERLYSLVFHELGHGYLDRDHVGGLSLMNPALAQTDDWQLYVDELFK